MKGTYSVVATEIDVTGLTASEAVLRLEHEVCSQLDKFPTSTPNARVEVRGSRKLNDGAIFATVSFQKESVVSRMYMINHIIVKGYITHTPRGGDSNDA